MRLVCPNCGAQYEVSEDAIPHDGRDVQCSNCAHTWFEQPGASFAAELGEDITPAAPEPLAEPAPDPTPKPAATPEPEPTPVAAPPRAREMAPEITDILREEAAFEEAARREEAAPIETQPDLGLSQDLKPAAPVLDATPDIDDAGDETEEDFRSRQARERLARLRGEEPPENAVEMGAVAGAAAVATGVVATQAADTPRRELLPDIEEINSTLRQDAQDQTIAFDEEDDPESSAFRRGFILVLLVAVLALAAYAFAPQISAAVPQIEPAMTSYVEWVDGVRLWFDARLLGLAEAFAPALTE